MTKCNIDNRKKIMFDHVRTALARAHVLGLSDRPRARARLSPESWIYLSSASAAMLYVPAASESKLIRLQLHH